MNHTTYDVSHMPTFISSIRTMHILKQREEEELRRRQEQDTYSKELYDELLDKFCFGSKNVGEMRMVLSRL